MTGPRRLREDDRGVSVALSHVLTLGITAILVAGLLMGATAMLDGQSERGAERSLETIGERVASEVASVDRLARAEPESRDVVVELRVDHPSEVSGVTYSIEIQDGNQCSPPEAPLLEGVEKCLILSAPGARTTTRVPVVVKSGIDTGTSVQGGAMTISYDSTSEEITLESGHR